ncbi:MAG: tetratricopeptide repeat protein [Verrucomicrobiia bacterium]
MKRYRLEILLFGMALVAASYFSHPVELDNVSSRFFMVSSIVDFGTLSIDAYKDRTQDTSSFDERYYSNKSIGTAVVGVPVYWALRHIPPFRDQPPLTLPQRYVVRVVTTSLPFALLAVTMFWLANRLGAAPRTALWVVLAYSLGTIALFHASIFSGHQLAASFSFFAFAILVYLRDRVTSHRGMGLAFGAGLLAGLAALADYTAMFTAAVLTIYAFSARIRPRLKLAFLFAGACCAALLAGYNWKCFGSAFSVSYSYLTLGENRTGVEHGLLGFSLPNPQALVGLLGSPSRGLLFIMPVFLFSLYGLFDWWHHPRGRAELYVILAIVVGYLTLISSFYFWHGSTTYGPRFLVPMLPFLAVPMIFSRVNTRWFLLAFAASILLVAPAMIGLAETHQWIRNPVVEVVIPCLSQGCLSDNWGSWLGLEFPWSILAVAALLAALARYAIHHLTVATPQSAMPWIEKVGVGTWLAVITVMLLTVRTSPPELVAGECARMHRNMAEALGARGYIGRAAAHYQEALRVKPGYVEAHENLAAALVQLGNVPEAMEHWEQVLRIKPDRADAHNNLGVALMGQGRLQEAIQHYEQALQINPDLVEAHDNLAAALVQLGNVPEAMEHWEQVLRIEPDRADAHNNLGVALMGQGRLQEAIQHYEQALRIKPDFAEAHNNWGLALEKLGRTPDAIEHYEQALRIKPDFVQAQSNLARAQALR